MNGSPTCPSSFYMYLIHWPLTRPQPRRWLACILATLLKHTRVVRTTCMCGPISASVAARMCLQLACSCAREKGPRRGHRWWERMSWGREARV